mgnify:CR=1 FL=1
MVLSERKLQILFFQVTYRSAIDQTVLTGPYRSGESWLAKAVLTWVKEALSSDTIPCGDYRELS